MITLRFAVQKSGRLTDGSRELISDCGIQVEPAGPKLRAPASNFPMEILFLRDDDIPSYVGDGTVDAAVVGHNVVVEQRSSATILRQLGFGRCRLSIAVPKGMPYDDMKCLAGKRISTSYPHILTSFLSECGVAADIHEISGSVEIAPSLGLADAICDLVSSGSTLLGNGLREVEPVFESQAVLICSPDLAPEKREVLDRLVFRIDAVLRARRSKYILLNAPNEAIPRIISLIPGLKSPSIVPLATEGWSALHTVVQEDEFWACIDDIRAAGAQGILVGPIEKVIL